MCCVKFVFVLVVVGLYVMCVVCARVCVLHVVARCYLILFVVGALFIFMLLFWLVVICLKLAFVCVHVSVTDDCLLLLCVCCVMCWVLASGVVVDVIVVDVVS